MDLVLGLLEHQTFRQRAFSSRRQGEWALCSHMYTRIGCYSWHRRRGEGVAPEFGSV